MRKPHFLFAVTIAHLLCAWPLAFGDQRSRRPEQVRDEASPILIFDSNGRVSLNAPATTTAQTVDVKVAPNFSFTFSPSTVNILAGDTVRWTWNAGGHNVRSGTPCTVDSQFCSPTDTNCTSQSTSNTNSTYSHTFTQPGTYSYFCSIHCGSGMTGTVNVATPFVFITSVSRDANGFTIMGQTNPNSTITIKSAPDLVTEFQFLGTTTANNAGGFEFNDMSATSALMRFYRASYP